MGKVRRGKNSGHLSTDSATTVACGEKTNKVFFKKSNSDVLLNLRSWRFCPGSAAFIFIEHPQNRQLRRLRSPALEPIACLPMLTGDCMFSRGFLHLVQIGFSGLTRKSFHSPLRRQGCLVLLSPSGKHQGFRNWSFQSSSDTSAVHSV